jgi:hypothetical protein
MGPEKRLPFSHTKTGGGRAKKAGGFEISITAQKKAIFTQIIQRSSTWCGSEKSAAAL